MPQISLPNLPYGQNRSGSSSLVKPSKERALIVEYETVMDLIDLTNKEQKGWNKDVAAIEPK